MLAILHHAKVSIPPPWLLVISIQSKAKYTFCVTVILFFHILCVMKLQNRIYIFQFLPCKNSVLHCYTCPFHKFTRSHV